MCYLICCSMPASFIHCIGICIPISMEAPCPYIIRPYLNMKNNDDTSRMDDGVGTDKII